MSATGRPGTSMYLAMLRIGSGVVAVSWILWLTGPLVSGIRDGWLWAYWYPATTAVLFLLAFPALITAMVVNRREVYSAALRGAGLTMVVALALLVFSPYTGQNNNVDGLWWTGFSALPAVAFAMSVTPQAAVAFFVVFSGGAAVVNAVVAGYTDPLTFTANVGFALVNGFLFVWLSASTLALGRIVDNTEDRARQNLVRAARLRARADEMARFTALVHDNVLSNLAAIGKRVRPAGLKEVRLASVFEGSPEIGPGQLTDAAVQAVRAATPDCQIETDVRKDAGRIPTIAASPMVLALAEVARNSARHAPGSRRRFRLHMSGGRTVIRFTDDGPGFDMADLRPTAAGLRISVLGRMNAVDGGRAELHSAPGQGTEVTLTWEGQDTWAQGQRVRADDSEDALADSPLARPRGMNVVFSWGYTAAVSVVFYTMMAANAGPADPVGLLTWAVLSTGPALLVGVDSGPLPRWRALLVCTAMCFGTLVGLWQGITGPDTWLRHWNATAALLVGALLTVRGCPRSALATVGVSTLLLWALTGTDPDTFTTPARYLTSALPIIAAVLVHIGRYSLIQSIPKAQERLRASAAEAAAEQMSAQSRAENLEMLETVAGPVFTAAASVTTIRAPLAQRAKLTEQRLRDMIRSPLLDVPELCAAVRDARAHGVTVLLLDDRSRAASDGVDARAAVDRLLGEFLRVVDAAQDRVHDAVPGPEGGATDDTDGEDPGKDGVVRGARVTVRLLPPGRSAFATVTDVDGVARFAASGERL